MIFEDRCINWCIINVEFVFKNSILQCQLLKFLNLYSPWCYTCLSYGIHRDKASQKHKNKNISLLEKLVVRVKFTAISKKKS